jgi:hypothetical protein
MGLRNCCPSYFFNQNEQGIPQVPLETATEVIAVPVTTTLPGDRVRIDSMLATRILTNDAGTDYGYNLLYTLFRDAQLLTAVVFSATAQVKQPGENASESDAPNITWTDVPPGPGTFNYRIEIFRRAFQEENLLAVQVLSRSIDAIVFPPVNP